VTELSRGQITEFLEAWKCDGREGLDALLPVIYQELRRLAQSYLRSERVGHTLQATAIVHEAYIRLVEHRFRNVETKGQFISVAALAMRRVLVDHARKKRAHKRRGAAVSVEEGERVLGRKPDLLELDVLLDELAKRDPRQAKVVELRYFGGLSLEETASVLHLSTATVSREWSVARAWLRRELTRGGG
jgi:RNA polymerase sigma factor (TIGR02999 family)